jgi:Tfp pilus assembly protein PilV
MRSRRRLRAGFSLIEVVLAMGVVAFCLVSIIGLLSVGIGSTDASTEQTTLANILSAVSADLRSTPNPSVAAASAATGQAAASPIYGIQIPPAGVTSSLSATPMSIYLGPNGERESSVAAARYLLSVWTSVPAGNRQEIVVRLMLSWPAVVPYASASGSVEDVMALNRT